MERSQISQKIFWKIVKGLFIQLLEKIILNLYYKMGYFCSKGTFYLSDIFGKDSAAKKFFKMEYRSQFNFHGNENMEIIRKVEYVCQLFVY